MTRTRRRGRLAAASLLVLALLAAAWAADRVLIEDWTGQAVGAAGVPAGWQAQSWGSPRYDLTVVENDGRKVLRLRSRDDSSTITKEIKDRINLEETPVLEWSWKVSVLPTGADARHKKTDDQAGQIFVVWPRFPEALRSRIIGYIWDTTAPAGTIVKSRKTGTITYVVVRSGGADIGKWVTEHRNVRDDFRTIYGEEPETPAAISLSVDSNDTHTSAEWLAGPILFRRP